MNTVQAGLFLVARLWDTIMRDPAFGLAFLETYADRLFFATDMVNTSMVFPLGAWLDEQLEKGTLSEDTYRKICWENAQRVFGL